MRDGNGGATRGNENVEGLLTSNEVAGSDDGVELIDPIFELCAGTFGSD